MIHSTPFNGRSTADHVLAGIDLTGKRFVVTGSSSGIGFETMNALAANGAQVVGHVDGRRFYKPAAFYRQSKLAVAVYAMELARRLRARGIAVNAVNPGAVAGTQLERHLRRPLLLRSVARLFRKNVHRAAATQAL